MRRSSTIGGAAPNGPVPVAAITSTPPSENTSDACVSRAPSAC
jgi:hypothetical protein